MSLPINNINHIASLQMIREKKLCSPIGYKGLIGDNNDDI
jgi:hypothetical protein